MEKLDSKALFVLKLVFVLLFKFFALTFWSCIENRSQDRYVLNGWIQTNVVEYFLFIGTAKHTKAAPLARKMSLFSSIIITIILSYEIIKIHIILHIYLQVTETEGLVELHWGIGQSALGKINLLCFHGISLAFSRMIAQGKRP